MLLRCAWLAVPLCACTAAPAVPPGFASLAAEAAEDEALRLCIEGERITGCAASLGARDLPPAVRIAADAIAPGGRTVFIGREWGPRGTGYRVEKAYQDGKMEHFQSLLFDADGSVLERSHSLLFAEVPQPVLLAAQAPGRVDVRRVDIVSGPSAEECYRVLIADRAGRTFMVECDLRGRRAVTRRIVTARVSVQ